MKIFKNIVLVFVFLIGWGVSSRAQETTELSLDSLQQSAMKMQVRQNSPVKASIFSAVLPGLGQAYNKKYWKVPIVIGTFGTIVYFIDLNTDYYNKYKRYYRDYLAQDPANKSYLELTIFKNKTLTDEDVTDGSYASWFESRLESGKDYYKRNRNLLYVGIVLAYVANIVDAAVDAHFKNFDVSDDLSFNFEPVVQPQDFGNFVGLQMRVTF